MGSVVLLLIVPALMLLTLTHATINAVRNAELQEVQIRKDQQ